MLPTVSPTMYHRVALGVVLSFLLVWAGCESEEIDDERPSGVPVDILPITLQDFQDRLELTGILEADDDAIVSAEASGRLQRRASLGTLAQEGESVASIDQRQPRAALRQAEAQLRAARAVYELAQDSYDRQEPLYRDSVISAIEFESVRAELEQAEANVEQAEAGLEQAQDQLDNTSVPAPFSGTVEEHFVRRGEQVNPGEPVLRMTNTETMLLNVGVPERYINDIDPDTPVEVRFRALGNEVVEGTINFVGGTVSPRSRTFRVEVEVPNEDGRLKPDMVGRVLMPRQIISDVVVVPRRAIERDEDGYRVYIIPNPESDEPRIESRLVSLGPTSQGRTAILDGLPSEGAVVVNGQNTAADGDAARIIERFATLDDAMIDPASTQRPVNNNR